MRNTVNCLGIHPSRLHLHLLACPSSLCTRAKRLSRAEGQRRAVAISVVLHTVSSLLTVPQRLRNLSYSFVPSIFLCLIRSHADEFRPAPFFLLVGAETWRCPRRFFRGPVAPDYFPRLIHKMMPQIPLRLQYRATLGTVCSIACDRTLFSIPVPF